MQFLENIKSSIYNPAYYGEILNKPFSYSLRYFLSLAALIAIVSTIVFSFSVLPKMDKVIGEIAPSVLKYYPDNLEITVKNGKVSTNVPEPYFIKMPIELRSSNQELRDLPAGGTTDNLLVIDTKSPLTIDLFKSYKTATLLGYDSFAYEDKGAIKIQPLDQSINGVVNKAKVSSALNEIMPFIKIIPLVLVPLVFIFSFIGFIFGNLIYLIFGALVIWLLIKAMKRDLRYGKAYQIGLHAITLGVILEATIFQIYPGLEFPFLFTILMLIIIWFNFKAIDNIVLPAPQMPAQGGEKK